MLHNAAATWREIGGVYAVFDTADSPLTQGFGLGVFEPVTRGLLDEIEEFFFSRGAHCDLEVSPFAGTGAVTLLCDRGYRPTEISSVMIRELMGEIRGSSPQLPVSVRIAETESDKQLWSEVSSRAWLNEMPDLLEFLRDMGTLMSSREDTICFLGEVDGEAGAAGSLGMHQGIALFSGAATLPHLRRRGLQGALLHARLRYAVERGCDIAMMVAMAGSDSQRNAERQGFRVAYTRMKWRKENPRLRTT